jgi:hypothetical protein
MFYVLYPFVTCLLTVPYILYIYFCVECNLWSCPTSLSLHVSAVHGHHQEHVYLFKMVPLDVKLHVACERDVY